VWTLLRVALFHAASSGSLKEDATALRLAGVVTLSHVALFFRLRKLGDWLQWIASRMLLALRTGPESLPFRLLLTDSTTVQGPRSRGTEWRLHYAVDLLTAECHFAQLTDASEGEKLERVPIEKGTVLFGDRNFFRPEGVRSVRQREGHVVLRLRWTHPRIEDAAGEAVSALRLAKTLRRAGEVGDWSVRVPVEEGPAVKGRIVAIRLPGPIAAKKRAALEKAALKKGKTLKKESLEAASFVLLFVTLPRKKFSARRVLKLYRYRWQVECAFKRLKQLLKIGHVPHQDESAARAWILGKLVLSLLLESLYRKAQTFSPWGFDEEAVVEAGGATASRVGG
jgi:hypothetical protein